MTDPDIITESDIDTRIIERGTVVSDDELMTFDEWWSEFTANICCTGYTRDCPCGGYTDRLPSGISRLLYDPEENF